MTSEARNDCTLDALVGRAPAFPRTWAMPNGDTFTVPIIGKFVQMYLQRSEVSVDPFARNKRWATHTNDLNPETGAEHHMDSIAFLKMLVAQGVHADLVIFDPPYSPRQIKECYNSVGIKMGALDAMRTNWMRERNLIALMQRPGDVVLSFGWNSIGMGKKRGYEIAEGMIVCHGVGHNDTICMAERRAVEQMELLPALAHSDPTHVLREAWRDCCDCIHDKEISSNRCRRCFDDPARPDWVAKWTNLLLDRKEDA